MIEGEQIGWDALRELTADAAKRPSRVAKWATAITPELILKLLQEREFLEEKVSRMLASGVPGVMHECDRAFYELTVRERDAARLTVDKLQALNSLLMSRKCHHDREAEAETEAADD